MMLFISSLFVFRIARNYNNEFDQKNVHNNINTCSKISCYKPYNEQELHEVFGSTNITNNTNFSQLGGMDMRTSNTTAISHEVNEQIRRIINIYEKSNIYKMNIHELEKIRKSGIQHPPEQKTQISASKISSDLEW